LTREQLAALDPAPDVVVVKPCGFALERTRVEIETLRELFRAMPWPAVRNGRVWLADGNAYFNRPGPRLVDSAEILAACIHPREFAHTHVEQVECADAHRDVPQGHDRAL
jgi:iron complex transport system substrate-binding protein